MLWNIDGIIQNQQKMIFKNHTDKYGYYMHQFDNFFGRSLYKWSYGWRKIYLRKKRDNWCGIKISTISHFLFKIKPSYDIILEIKPVERIIYESKFATCHVGNLVEMSDVVLLRKCFGGCGLGNIYKIKTIWPDFSFVVFPSMAFMFLVIDRLDETYVDGNIITI